MKEKPLLFTIEPNLPKQGACMDADIEQPDDLYSGSDDSPEMAHLSV